jgi:hypothetical protein
VGVGAWVKLTSLIVRNIKRAYIIKRAILENQNDMAFILSLSAFFREIFDKQTKEYKFYDYFPSNLFSYNQPTSPFCRALML